eukprot:Nk52_evm4s1444 gene=Nk52_evmTU4s1444
MENLKAEVLDLQSNSAWEPEFEIENAEDTQQLFTFDSPVAPKPKKGVDCRVKSLKASSGKRDSLDWFDNIESLPSVDFVDENFDISSSLNAKVSFTTEKVDIEGLKTPKKEIEEDICSDSEDEIFFGTPTEKEKKKAEKVAKALPQGITPSKLSSLGKSLVLGCKQSLVVFPKRVISKDKEEPKEIDKVEKQSPEKSTRKESIEKKDILSRGEVEQKEAEPVKAQPDLCIIKEKICIETPSKLRQPSKSAKFWDSPNTCLKKLDSLSLKCPGENVSASNKTPNLPEKFKGLYFKMGDGKSPPDRNVRSPKPSNGQRKEECKTPVEKEKDTSDIKITSNSSTKADDICGMPDKKMNYSALPKLSTGRAKQVGDQTASAILEPSLQEYYTPDTQTQKSKRPSTKRSGSKIPIATPVQTSKKESRATVQISSSLKSTKPICTGMETSSSKVKPAMPKDSQTSLLGGKAKSKTHFSKSKGHIKQSSLAKKVLSKQSGSAVSKLPRPTSQIYPDFSCTEKSQSYSPFKSEFDKEEWPCASGSKIMHSPLVKEEAPAPSEWSPIKKKALTFEESLYACTKKL